MKVYLILLITFLSCTTEKKEKPVAFITTAVQTGAYKSQSLSDTASDLLTLFSIQDSFPAYIRLNRQLYNSLLDSGNSTAAIEYFDNIINQHERVIKDTSLKKILAETYFWSAYYQPSGGYNDEVVKKYEQFLLITKDQPRHSLYPYANNYLGIQYNKLGDLKKCVYYYNQYGLDALAEQNYEWYASAVINTTVALNELQLYDSTIHLISNALAFKTITPKRQALLYTNLATAQAGKHLYNEAIANAYTALNIIKELPPAEIDANITEKKYQCLWNLGEIQSQSGNVTMAATTLDDALQIAISLNDNRIHHREIGKMFIARGRVSEKTNKLQQAMLYYQKALASVTNVDSSKTDELPKKELLYTENTIMEALDAKADLLQKIYQADNDSNKLKLAVQCYTLAFDVEDRLMQGFSYDESLTRQAQESKERSEKAITACYQLFQLTQQQIWAEKAFLFAEKSKAVVLLESIRRNIAANNILQNDSLLQQVQSLQLRIAYYEQQLLSDTRVNDTSTAVRNEREKINRQKYSTETELLAAKTVLMHSKGAYREALLKPDTLSITALKNKLPDKSTAIVEFFEGHDNTWSFVISKELPVQFLQYTQSILNRTDTLLEYFTNASRIVNDPAGFQQTAYQLYTDLQWQQFNKEWRRLIIIPDGRFSFLPFDALITQPPAGNLNLQQASYLLQEYEPMYAYSAAILLKQMEQSERSTDRLAVFAPLFTNSERLQQPLPNTRKETETIGRHKKGNYFVARNATLSNFRKELSAAGIVHIASHAYADTTNATIPRIEFIDSSLLLNELYALQTKASLVVLSGCETGIGQVNKSEGPLSLARGFYYAGAGNVITSYWSIDDKSTAELFGHFYKNIQTNSYSQVLHQAKLDYINQASATEASPYYWAGFVHIGYPQQQHSSKNSRWWWLLFIPVIAFATWLYRKK